MIVGFIKQYQSKKKKVLDEYIGTCHLINSYYKSNNMPISEVANAMIYAKIPNELPLFVKDENMDFTSQSKDLFYDLLDEVSSYGIDYLGGIKKETYDKFNHLMNRKSDLISNPDLDYPPDKIIDDNISNDDKSFSKVISTIEKFIDANLHRQPYFSPFEACCLIAGKSPRDLSNKFGAYDICEEWEYLSAKNYVKKAFDDGRLYLTDECLGISSLNLKTVLYEDGKIIKGFNDDIIFEIYEELINPVISIETHSNLFNKEESQYIEFKVPQQLQGDLLNSYTINLEKKLSELQAEDGNKDDLILPKILCLIAIMKNLLLNPEITSFYFSNSDNPNSKIKPIQGELSRHISEYKIKGLSKRNIDDIFSLANTTLKDIEKL